MFEYTGTARSTTTPVLAGGDYQWRAQSNTGAGWSVWTPIWTFTITPPTTVAPVLISPAGGAVLDTTTPNFTWNPVTNGDTYQIQIARTDTFAKPVQDETLLSGVLTYTADPLPDGGKYYWRVRAINVLGVAGAWSASTSLHADAIGRADPAQPGDRDENDGHHARSGLEPGGGCGELPASTGYALDLRQPGSDRHCRRITTYTASALPDGKYYWRVRGVDAAGIPGKWSAAWNITIDTTGPAQPVLLHARRT